MTIKIAMLGFGNVGQALALLLERKRTEIHEAYGISYKIVGIATGSHGIVQDPEGIEAQAAVDLIQRGDNLESLSNFPAAGNTLEFVDSIGADVLFENTPVEYEMGQPAISHLEHALNQGMHAITANKGPVVHGHQILSRLAEDHGVHFYFESTVMDGAPLFSLWRETLPGAQLRSFRGLLNSTTNLILTKMEAGEDFEDAVRSAQEIGIAETDPSGDTHGWDAAIKIAALVTVLMGRPILPSEVERSGIQNLTAKDIEEARQEGRRWKLVCEAAQNEEGVQASVQPIMIDDSDPLYNVMGTSSAVTFETDVLGPITIAEDDPGPHTTAYGLLADFLNAVKKA